jgi:HK97 family phage portal protein
VIFGNAVRSLLNPQNATTTTGLTLPALVEQFGVSSTAGETVSQETSKSVATAFRCGNIISDDVAKMPLQWFSRPTRGRIDRIVPDGLIRNIAFQTELSPNSLMTPFIFKKAVMLWLLYWGNAYIWQPPMRHELIILPANCTYPQFSAKDGSLWFHTIFPNGMMDDLPSAEVLQLMINSVDGYQGRSVISYARDTIGQQIAAHKTQGKFFSQGMNPAGIAWVSGEASKEARAKIRDSYEEAISGTGNAARLAIMDNRITKFEPITMKFTDAQFLESIQATDVDIANFFGLPLYKLNSGKQSYQSNEQQNIDYLTTTLDPYLVQWEQAAALKWLTVRDQGKIYPRFNRDVLLRTDATARAAYLEKKILSGQMSPNEAREIEDVSSYQGGDKHYMPANFTPVDESN